jgi:arylsulfatase A-like enzyme
MTKAKTFCSQETAMTTEQPNFLFIITDQQRADHLGCYGNPIIDTPNVDAIAARGLAFDQFYVSCPICMPNRATLMTGRMPSVNGVLTNGLPLPLGSTTFVDLLRAAGYRTALLGKSHLQNMVPSDVEDWNYPPRRDGTPPPPDLDDAYRTRPAGPEYEFERSDLWMKDPNRQVSGPYYGFDDIAFANLHGDRVQGH